MRRLLATVVLTACLAGAQTPAPPPDPILKAMADELARSARLALVEKPYFIEYVLDDTENFVASATMGSLLNSNRNRFRVPQVQVRIGDYGFDNTNHVYSAYYSGARQDSSQLPIDDRYDVLRRFLWLATDRAYKTAIEGMSRKRGSLKGISRNPADDIPDFARATPSRIILPPARFNFDDGPVTRQVIRASTVFREYPEVMDSSVEASTGQGTTYYVNNEGTLHRYPDSFFEIRVRAIAQAPDGMALRSSFTTSGPDLSVLPDDAQVESAAKQVAGELRELVKAPVGETYSGPVLFEPRAAAQMFAQALGNNIRASRRPLSDAGRPAPYLPSEFEAKIGSRVLPEWMDVVDDPTQKEWHGRKLAGSYIVDMEGVPPIPVPVIEKGVLKNFLMTRQPVKGFAQTNGHARLTGPYGARSAAIGNLFIKSSQTSPLPDLKKKLIEMCQQRGKPYGLLVRKLDFPSSMSIADVQAFAASMQGAGARPLSPPVLVYRVYPDGREELVRGLRFRGFSTRLLRDIVAASDDPYVFDFLNNGYPFALIGGAGYVAPSTVVSPAVLFDELELERAPDDRSKPPAVPAPPIS